MSVSPGPLCPLPLLLNISRSDSAPALRLAGFPAYAPCCLEINDRTWRDSHNKVCITLQYPKCLCGLLSFQLLVSPESFIIPQNTGWRRKWYSHTLFGLSPNDCSHSNMHTLSNSTILGGVDIAAYTYLKLTALTESEFNLVELNVLKRISHQVCSSDCECCPALCGDGAESFHGNKSSTSYLSDRQRQKEF